MGERDLILIHATTSFGGDLQLINPIRDSQKRKRKDCLLKSAIQVFAGCFENARVRQNPTII